MYKLEEIKEMFKWYDVRNSVWNELEKYEYDLILDNGTLVFNVIGKRKTFFKALDSSLKVPSNKVRWFRLSLFPATWLNYRWIDYSKAPLPSRKQIIPRSKLGFEVPECIWYAIATDPGDESVGIFEKNIRIGVPPGDVVRFDQLLDLSIFAEDERENVVEELRDSLQRSMEICLDTAHLIFDFEQTDWYYGES